KRPQTARDFLLRMEEVIRLLPAEEGDTPDTSLTGMPAEVLVPADTSTPRPRSAPASVANVQPTEVLPPAGLLATLSEPRFRPVWLGGGALTLVLLLWITFRTSPGPGPDEVPVKTPTAGDTDTDTDGASLQDFGSQRHITKAPDRTTTTTTTSPAATTDARTTTAADPSAGATTGDRGDDDGEDSGKTQETKKDRYATPECERTRKAVSEARTAGDWNAMLKYLERERHCF